MVKKGFSCVKLTWNDPDRHHSILGESLAVPSRGVLLFLVVAWVTIFPSEALAYLDPGTGSLVIQSVVAALAAAAFGLRLYWRRIRMWFKRPGTQSDSPSDGTPGGTV